MDHRTRFSRFLKHCADVSARGTVWISLGLAFLVLGISTPSAGYIGIGAAFVAIGVSRAVRKQRGSSSD